MPSATRYLTKDTMTQPELLDRLESDLSELLKLVRANFVEQPLAALAKRPSPEKWNAQECFAHLNAQFDYYLPRIELALHKAKARRWLPVQERRSNWFGRRAVRAANPTPLRPRRSRKAIDPSKLLNVRPNEVKIFLINLEMMLRLLRQAREVDTNMPRIQPMQWSLFKFTLGDLLEYLVLHAKRHVSQAGNSF